VGFFIFTKARLRTNTIANLKPETLNLKLETWNLKPETRNKKQHYEHTPRTTARFQSPFRHHG